nr:MAG TPA: hypothetical protein [Caudoviricetes sp.]
MESLNFFNCWEVHVTWIISSQASIVYVYRRRFND